MRKKAITGSGDCSVMCIKTYIRTYRSMRGFVIFPPVDTQKFFTQQLTGNSIHFKWRGYFDPHTR